MSLTRRRVSLAGGAAGLLLVEQLWIGALRRDVAERAGESYPGNIQAFGRRLRRPVSGLERLAIEAEMPGLDVQPIGRHAPNPERAFERDVPSEGFAGRTIDRGARAGDQEVETSRRILLDEIEERPRRGGFGPAELEGDLPAHERPVEIGKLVPKDGEASSAGRRTRGERFA